MEEARKKIKLAREILCAVETELALKYPEMYFKMEEAIAIIEEILQKTKLSTPSSLQ